MTELLQTIGIIILALTSIGGWAYTLRRNGKNEGIFEQKMNDLPCIKDSNYEYRSGKLAAKVQSLSHSIEKLEFSNTELHKRIDETLISRPRSK